MNVIADNILSQIDSDGFSTALMESILYYNIDEAIVVPKSEKHILISSGQQRHHISVSDCKLLVQLKYVSEIWVPLKDLN